MKNEECKMKKRGRSTRWHNCFFILHSAFCISNHHWRNFKNALSQIVAFLCALLVVTPLILVFYHLVKLGFSSLNFNFFTQLPKSAGETGGGMGNAIAGTFILLAQAAIIGVPIGVLGGIFLS